MRRGDEIQELVGKPEICAHTRTLHLEVLISRPRPFLLFTFSPSVGCGVQKSQLHFLLMCTGQLDITVYLVSVIL